ncbi:hypothetical protein [Nonomuraea sp. SBT364]|uniref:hypothetical protein n=1 Tax=Nonomuraea sp. SBT364 TaxID=1580530 RepID=UPI00066A830D|nr:hypothetical protein [Nonomuraea sp. SBT364]
MRKVATTLLAAGALLYLTATIAIRGADAADEVAGIIAGFSLVLTALGLLRQRGEAPAHRPCPAGPDAGAPPRPAVPTRAFTAGRMPCAETAYAGHGPVFPLGWLVLDTGDGRSMVGGAIRELRELGGRLPDGMVLVLFALPEWHAPPGHLVMAFGIGMAPR